MNLLANMTTLQSPPPSPTSNKRGPLEIPYSESFTDELMRIVLQPHSPSGKVVSDKGLTITTNGDSVQLEDAYLPDVDPSELPIPIEDPRRIYRSAVPGIRLTHPGGPLEGGAPPFQPSGTSGITGQIPDDIRDYARQLIRENSPKNLRDLQKLIASETQKQILELKKRMSERNEAKEQNEQTQKEIDDKDEVRAIERKIEEKCKREAAARRDSNI